MTRVLAVLSFAVVTTLAIGCDSTNTSTGPTTALPPSKEVRTKDGKSKMVADELPPPPTRTK
jgi:hypothetical protein